MVKSETRRDAEILVRNPSPRLFGKKFRDSKKVKTNHAKTRLRDLSKTLRDFEILPKFSETHVFRGTIRNPYSEMCAKRDLTVAFLEREGSCVICAPLGRVTVDTIGRYVGRRVGRATVDTRSPMY